MAIPRGENWLDYHEFPVQGVDITCGGGGGGRADKGNRDEVHSLCQKIRNKWVMVATGMFRKNRLWFPLVCRMVHVGCRNFTVKCRRFTVQNL